MTRKWSATGVIDHLPVKGLDANTKKQIINDLKSREMDIGNIEGFFEELSQAIASYNSGKALAETSKPSLVRDDLKRSISRALELKGDLNQLNGNSRELLAEVVDGGTRSLHSDINNVLTALNSALRLANEYPKTGRLNDHPRHWLAVDVANAISSQLGVEPTTTKQGIFESILSIILEVVTGKEVKAANELARKAIVARKL